MDGLRKLSYLLRGMALMALGGVAGDPAAFTAAVEDVPPKDPAASGPEQTNPGQTNPGQTNREHRAE